MLASFTTFGSVLCFNQSFDLAFVELPMVGGGKGGKKQLPLPFDSFTLIHAFVSK